MEQSEPFLEIVERPTVRGEKLKIRRGRGGFIRHRPAGRKLRDVAHLSPR